MSSITGGRYLRNSNDLAAGFKSAAADLAGSYTLGFLVSDEPDSKWHFAQGERRRSGVEPPPSQGATWPSRSPPAGTLDQRTGDGGGLRSGRLVGGAADGLLRAGSRWRGRARPGSQPADRTRVAALPDRGANLQARVQVLFAERSPDGTARLTTDRRHGQSGRRAVGSGAAKDSPTSAAGNPRRMRCRCASRRAGRDHRKVLGTLDIALPRAAAEVKYFFRGFRLQAEGCRGRPTSA